jgi:hypothetical protein
VTVDHFLFRCPGGKKKEKERALNHVTHRAALEMLVKLLQLIQIFDWHNLRRRPWHLTSESGTIQIRWITLRATIRRPDIMNAGCLDTSGSPLSQMSRGRETTITSTKGEPEVWQRTIERVVRSVVSVRYSQPHSFDTGGPQTGEATGFVVDAEKG